MSKLNVNKIQPFSGTNVEVTGSLKIDGSVSINGNDITNRGTHTVINSMNDFYNFWPEGLGDYGGMVSIHFSDSMVTSSGFLSWSAETEYNPFTDYVYVNDDVLYPTPGKIYIEPATSSIDWVTAGQVGYVTVNGNQWMKMGTFISGGWESGRQYYSSQAILVNVNDEDQLFIAKRAFVSSTESQPDFTNIYNNWYINDGNGEFENVESWVRVYDFEFYDSENTAVINKSSTDVYYAAYSLQNRPMIIDPYNNIWFSTSWFYKRLSSGTDIENAVADTFDGDILWKSADANPFNHSGTDGTGFRRYKLTLPLNKPHGSTVTFSSYTPHIGTSGIRIDITTGQSLQEYSSIESGQFDSITTIYNAYHGYWFIENT
jgi:hypothetical protein